jgi:hypothetical protein
MKLYSNKFASMEQQADSTWLVFNEVTGLPDSERDADDLQDTSRPIFYPDYQSARNRMVELTTRYKYQIAKY